MCGPQLNEAVGDHPHDKLDYGMRQEQEQAIKSVEKVAGAMAR